MSLRSSSSWTWRRLKEPSQHTRDFRYDDVESVFYFDLCLVDMDCSLDLVLVDLGPELFLDAASLDLVFVGMNLDLDLVLFFLGP